MAIWTLTAGPPDLAMGVWLHDNLPQVSILEMVPLALQKRVEEADVWPWLIGERARHQSPQPASAEPTGPCQECSPGVECKSCGGPLRQTVLYLKTYTSGCLHSREIAVSDFIITALS